MPLTRYELETIINFNEEQKTARIFTYNKGWQNHMEKLGIKPELVNDFGGKYNIEKRGNYLSGSGGLGKEGEGEMFYAIRK